MPGSRHGEGAVKQVSKLADRVDTIGKSISTLAITGLMADRPWFYDGLSSVLPRFAW
jgi:hypothetical protein